MSWRVSTTLLLTAWGALAFGAVYPWAFIPLFIGCAVVGFGAMLAPGAVPIDRLCAGVLSLLLAAIALQLVPIPVGAIRWLSPETDRFLQQYSIAYGASRHALSIRPDSTALALAACGALAALFLGLARSLTERDARQIASGVALLGVTLAIIGVVQKATWNGKIYGFWTPIQPGDSFGPFVNRNHFAGWMLMALPLTLGSFKGRLARGVRDIKPGWRDRLLWLASAEANETILVAFAAVLMAAALTLTMSRSGMLGLVIVLAAAAWIVIRRQAGSRRAIAALLLALIVFIAIGVAGVDRLATRFEESGSANETARLGIWTDTWHIARRFPLTGTGLNTYGTATIFYQTADLSRHYAEAHNDYLQIVAEGGVLVVLPAILVMAALVRTVWRQQRSVQVDRSDYWIRAGAIAGSLAIALQEAVDFSLQMPGNAVLFVVLLAIAARPAAARKSRAVS